MVLDGAAANCSLVCVWMANSARRPLVQLSRGPACPAAKSSHPLHSPWKQGAGVCGLAAEIMATYPHRPLVISYAPHDSHTNQVQLCGERGVPDIIFSMAR